MSEKADIKLFELLKKKIAATLRSSYPGNHDDISQWKGQEIKLFQDDLMEKVQGRISEKWFYTHLKSEHNTIPRVDILNLLCRYCGYEDWIDFKAKHKPRAKKKWRYAAILAALIIVISWFAFSTRYYEYEIEVVDAYTMEPVRNERLEVVWLKEGESPQHFHHINEGRLTIRSDQKEVRLVIKAPYYFADTIVRKIPYKQWSERLTLQPDDLSLMIHYFSSSDEEKWETRREKLRDAFAFNATIFQVNSDGQGMGIYNKEEFINKLTLPVQTLKNIEVLETRISKGKIVFLRFNTEHHENN